MKKTYIAPETEIVNIQVENMLVASIELGGSASSGGVTEADIKELGDLFEMEEAINNLPLW